MSSYIDCIEIARFLQAELEEVWNERKEFTVEAMENEQFSTF